MRLSSSPLAFCARVLRHNMKGHPRQDPRSSHTIRSRSGTSGPSGSAPPCGFLKKIETSTITFNTWTSILLPQQVFFFFFQHLHTVTLSAVKTPPGCTFLHSRSLGILSGPSLHYPGLSFLSEEFVGSLDGSLGWNGCTNLNRSGQLTNLSATPRSETLQSHLCRHSTNCTQDYQTSLSGQ